MEHSVVSHLQPNLVGRLNGGVELDGITGWAAGVVEAHRRGTAPLAPNPSPWAHLGSLDRVSEQLSAALR